MNVRTAHDEKPVQGRLRILQTTDLHMHLLGYDYFADRPDENIGLCVLADAIAALRTRDDSTTLLFDNGDFLQGNPLADHLAETLEADEVHPIAAAMNALGYDALTLGNHEFDYGLPFLRQVLDQLDCPKASANILAADGTPMAAPYVMLKAPIACSDGVSRTLKVGVTGFGPPQPTDCDGSESEAIKITDIIETARTIIPEVKAAGADIIIALCHSGIGAAQASPLMENAAVPLADIAGIDVVLTGHTHEFFPDDARPATQNVDPITGRINDKPAVMAGYYGSALGMIDLSLAWDGNGWRVDNADVSLVLPNQKVHPHSKIRQKIETITDKSHQATLYYIREPIARLAGPMHSYFATITPDLCQQLLAEAMRDKVGKVLDCDEPVLAAVSPFRFGGKAGLGQYIDVPDGLIARKDAAAMFPFTDKLCAVRRTGAQIRDWLERSAARYNQIEAGSKRQQLLNPLAAGYNCDAIYGLQYTFDLTQPARFDPSGNIINADARRISTLTLHGKPVSDTDRFIVAANSFRIKGGGSFAQVPSKDILWMDTEKLRDVLVTSLKSRTPIAVTPEKVWRFAPVPDTHAQFQSAQAAIPHASGNIRHDATDDTGLATFSLVF